LGGAPPAAAAAAAAARDRRLSPHQHTHSVTCTVGRRGEDGEEGCCDETVANRDTKIRHFVIENGY
jgi:hypothetical protein